MIPIQNLLKEIKSYYRLVLVASERANELSGGAQPLVISKNKKFAIHALEEIASGKIHGEMIEVKKTKVKKEAKSKKA